MTLKPITTLLVSLSLLLLPVLSATAQVVDDFTITHIGAAEGLSSQRIYDIRQTDDGAVWWSNKDNVERYNGVRLKSYHLGSTTTFNHSGGRIFKFAHHTPPANDKQQPASRPLVVFDNKGGIFTYDEADDDFVQQADLKAMTGSDVLLNDVLLADSGAWIAMREGVWFLKGANGGRTATQLLPVVKGQFANLIVPSKSGFLLCMRDGVLGYRMPHHAIPQNNPKLSRLMQASIESAYYDASTDIVWLGSYQSGLHMLRFTGNGHHVTHCAFPAPSMHSPIRCICPYNDDVMLVGIDGLGVYKIARHPSPADPISGTLLFNANEGHEGVLHGNGIYSMICDTWGNIIIGSYSGGIDIARPVGSTPAIYRHERGNTQSLLNDRVNCVAQFPDGTLVMGTDNGVSLLNPLTHHWQHLCHDAVVLSFCFTPQGTLLAATYGKGVYEITRQGHQRQCYHAHDGVLTDDHVYKLLFDHRGSLWMGCLDGDLVEHTGSSTRYYPINNVQDILQLPDRRIAVGTANGVWLIDTHTGGVTKLDYAPKGTDDINYYVNTLYMDDDNRLWIGTDGGGIYIYHLNTRESRQVTTANGLPSNVVSSLCKDVKGRVLVTTERGLAFALDSRATRFVNVNYCYGIEREYSSRAVVRLQNGFMLYGTTSGALLIDPENIQKINYSARLKLTGVSCRNDSTQQFRQQIHRMLQEHELQLSYSQRTFELHFEAINLRNQFDIVYQYQMDGGSWSRPDDQQYIRFTNLEAGSHELRLRSVSRTCGEVLNEVVLNVRIGQPWWNTWWMWTVYLCLLFLAFYGAWRVYQLHEKYMRLVISTPRLEDPAVQPAPELAAGEHSEHGEDGKDSDDGDDGKDSDDGKNSDDGKDFVDKVTHLVIDNLSDTTFNIDRLCREMAMSRTLFYVKLKSYTGKSPQDFIRIIRLERAASLLRKGRNVSDAAALAGFDNAKYFSTIFKKYFGVSPSKYG